MAWTSGVATRRAELGRLDPWNKFHGYKAVVATRLRINNASAA